MSPTDPNNLDIWGEPIGERRDCFLCGEHYLAEESDAPIDYRTTYCSFRCYNADLKQLRSEAKLDEQLDSGEARSHDLKIGEFRLKVRKES